MHAYTPLAPGLTRGLDGDWYDDLNGAFVFSPISERFTAAPVQTLSSATPVELANWNTVDLPVGEYDIRLSFGWNYNNINSDIIVDFEIDGASPDAWSGATLRQEPKDSGGNVDGTGSAQAFPFSRHWVKPLSGVTNFTLDLSGETGTVDASVWSIVLTCHRIR